MEQWGTLITQWGIVVAFAGTMAALVFSFKALPKEQRAKYKNSFQICMLAIGLGTIMQLIGIIGG